MPPLAIRNPRFVPLLALAMGLAACSRQLPTPSDAEIPIDHQMSGALLAAGLHLTLTPTRRATTTDSIRAAAVADTLRPGHRQVRRRPGGGSGRLSTLRARLVIGTGTRALPVMDEVKREGGRRKIALVIVPTVRAIELLKQRSAETNAILHVTC